MRTISYKPCGTCCTEIIVSLDGRCIADVCFVNGCAGNGLGIASLLRGMPIADAIARLEGINCGQRGTSCPDQLAQALKMVSIIVWFYVLNLSLVYPLSVPSAYR